MPAGLATATLRLLRAEFDTHCAALAEAPPAEQAAILVELHAQLLRHFAYEEDMMARLTARQAAVHRREHSMVLSLITKVRAMCREGDTQVAQRLASELALWLDRHSASMDAELLQSHAEPPTVAAAT